MPRLDSNGSRVLVVRCMRFSAVARVEPCGCCHCAPVMTWRVSTRIILIQQAGDYSHKLVGESRFPQANQRSSHRRPSLSFLHRPCTGKAILSDIHTVEWVCSENALNVFLVLFLSDVLAIIINVLSILTPKVCLSLKDGSFTVEIILWIDGLLPSLVSGHWWLVSSH